jgi:N-acetylneuraminic acid mutarotase
VTKGFAMSMSRARIFTALFAPLAMLLVPGVAAQTSPVPPGSAPPWVLTGSLNVPRAAHSAVALRDGRVLIAGGFDSWSKATESAEIYDPATGKWQMTGSLNHARAQHTATLLADGRVLVAGGVDSADLDSAEIYDPRTAVWSETGNLNTARVFQSATLLPSGKVLIIGGSGDYDRTRTAELYDPVSGTWSYAAPPGWARNQGNTATLLEDGKVLVAGGIVSDYDPGATPAASNAELYDWATDSWLSVGSPIVAFGHTATLLANGDVILTAGDQVVPCGGGGECMDGRYARLYDARGQTWSVVNSLANYREGQTATRLADGRVLVAGGGGYSDYSVELYDPVSRTWSQTTNLNVDRGLHSATLLADGRVLIAGGTITKYTDSEDWVPVLNVAEVYEGPATGTITAGFTGSWYDPAQNGHGLHVEVLPNNGFLAAWFTFNPAGTEQAWFVGVGNYSGNTATIDAVVQPTGGAWIPHFDPSHVVINPWGALTFTFTDCNHGHVDFSSVRGYGVGGMDLTRLTQPDGLACP